MRILLLITTPYGIIWLATRKRRAAYRWIGFGTVALVQAFSLLPIGAIILATSLDAEQEQANSTAVRLGSLYSDFTITQGDLHGLAGWEGVDIKAGCGEAIRAPFDGEITYNGLDGYNQPGYDQSTMLTIIGDDMEMTLLHGDYNLPVGTPVKRGDVIGKENRNGWATGCHSHVVLKQNGRLLNYLEWEATYHASYPLRISWYDPSLGGTNCDHDCSTMASGDKVASWIGGRGGVFAAACPRSDGWHHGVRFVLDGVTYECRDTGGWINCYSPGMYDPALKRQADMDYCWVDLLNGSHYQYGSLAYDWGFVER